MVHYKSTRKRSQKSYNRTMIIMTTMMSTKMTPLLSIDKIMTSRLDEEEEGIAAT